MQAQPGGGYKDPLPGNQPNTCTMEKPNKITVIVATCATMAIDRILINEDKPLVVTENFDVSKPMGMARLFKDKGNIMAEIVLMPSKRATAILGSPALGGQFVKSKLSNYCTAGMIMSISIGAPNVDANVLPIYTQLDITLPIPQTKNNFNE